MTNNSPTPTKNTKIANFTNKQKKWKEISVKVPARSWATLTMKWKVLWSIQTMTMKRMVMMMRKKILSRRRGNRVKSHIKIYFVMLFWGSKTTIRRSIKARNPKSSSSLSNKTKGRCNSNQKGSNNKVILWRNQAIVPHLVRAQTWAVK